MTRITLAMGWTAPLWGQLQSFKFRQWLICMNSWIKGPLLCNLSLARSCIYAIVCWQSVSCSSLTSRCTPDKNANPVIQRRDQRNQWHLSGTMSDPGTNQLTVFLFLWLKMLWVGVKRNDKMVNKNWNHKTTVFAETLRPQLRMSCCATLRSRFFASPRCSSAL